MDVLRAVQPRAVRRRADLALHAYTHTADAIGYTLGPAVRAWLERVRSEPGHVPLEPDPTRATENGQPAGAYGRDVDAEAL